MRYKVGILLLPITIIQTVSVSSFQLVWKSRSRQRLPTRPISSHSSSTTLRSTVRQNDIKERKKEALQNKPPKPNKKDLQGRVVRMKFVGTKSVSTSPIPLPRGGVPELTEFFAVGKHRNLLFFRNDVSVLRNPSKEQINKWSDEATLGGGGNIELLDSQKEKYEILRMKALLQMPGLRILVETIIGVKLATALGNNDHETGYPEYQFTVIDTKLKPEGSAPLVWLFNQLTTYLDGTSSFTRVRARNAGGVNCDKVVFTTDARLETRIHIPSAVVRVLPMNVAKFEQQGSKSMQKLLEKELGPALNCFCDVYLKWLSN